MAGSIGAGKSTVARAVAECLSAPLHSIDDDKRAVGAATPQFASWVAEGTPFPDDFRVAVFARTLDKLAEIRRSSPHVVVEETFHRKALRDQFFDSAGELLGGFALVEVVADEATIIERLRNRATTEAGHLAGIDMHRAFLAVSDPQDRAGYVFDNGADFASELERCCAFLRAAIRDADGSGRRSAS